MPETQAPTIGDRVRVRCRLHHAGDCDEIGEITSINYCLDGSHFGYRVRFEKYGKTYEPTVLASEVSFEDEEGKTDET